MNTRIPLILAFATACAIATANEALDILEGHNQPVDIATIGQENNASFEPAWPSWQTTTFDPLWAKAILFEDPENPWVQQLALTGFFDTHLFNGNKARLRDEEGNEASTNDLKWDRETSRARLGARMRAFGNTDINAMVEWYSVGSEIGSGATTTSPDGDVFFLDELSAVTGLSDNTSVTYGKFRPGFSAEFRQDIAASPYPGRSLLAEFITPDPTLGLKVNYRSGDMEYGYGWFMSDSDEWIPDIEKDGMFSFSVAQHLKPTAGSKSRTTVYADYIHNFDASRPDGFDKSTGGFSNRIINGQLSELLADLDLVVDGASIDNPALRHLASVGFHSENEQWSVVGDIMIAKGDLDIGGITLAPSRWIVPGLLKAAGRYNLVVIDQDPTITMHTIFLGLNAHLYRDRLLLMTGYERWIIEQSEGEAKAEADFWHTGVRASF